MVPRCESARVSLMSSGVDFYVQAVVSVLVITDPITRGILFKAMTAGEPQRRREYVRKIAMTVAITLGVAAIAGKQILDGLGIDLGAFGIAGGLVVSLVGFEMLFGVEPSRAHGGKEAHQDSPGQPAIVRRVSSRGVRLNHITLPAIDVEASATFYARLGLTQIVAHYPEYARLLSPRGETTLSLHRAERSVGSPRASIHFEVDDVNQTVERLRGEGFTFVCDPVDQPYLWREAIMLDPDGHHVFIYHAGENRLDPPWRLDSGSGAQSA